MADITRRSAIGMALAAASASAWTPQGSLDSVFDLPAGDVFGIKPDGAPRDAESVYRAKTPAASELSFDVSNNQIAASFSRNGEMARCCCAIGVAMLSPESMKGGVYSEKRLIYGGPWQPRVTLNRAEVVAGQSSVRLLGNVFPLFETAAAGVRMRQVVFAPGDERDARAPRALIALVAVRNEGRASVSGKVECSTPREAIGGVQKALVWGDDTFVLSPGAQKVVALAYLLGGTDEELRVCESQLRARRPAAWFESTWRVRTEAYGALSVPAAQYYADSMARLSETCRQSFLRLPDGKVAGAFLGSDVDSRAINWVRDSYYSALAMSMFEPRLCSAAIEYLLEWNLPPEPTARGLARFPAAGRVTQSLGNALAPLALGGYYYQFTGDGAWFRARPKFLLTACALLDDVLRSRRGEPYLFPSMFISDGDARGQYHTGSNIMAARAFRSTARLAREVYNDTGRASEWERIAGRIEADVRSYCCGEGPLGRQFFEGVEANGAFVPGHDGEESDTTLAAFYGFCAADDPAMVRHARLAMRASNPYYAPGVDGIWWFNEKWGSATFPAWITALAGASDKKELAAHLARIRQLTDLDGSIWWWPYKYGAVDPAAVLRASGARKCGWASGVYLCRFIHDILGLDVDVPARRVSFRPFTPWREFSWKSCRIGAAEFDLDFRAENGTSVASVMNRTAFPYEVTIELLSRDGKSGLRYQRPTSRITRTVSPGRVLRLEVSV